MIGAGPAGALVSLKLTSTKDTFLRLSPQVSAQLHLEQEHAVEVSCGEHSVYLGWMEYWCSSCLGYNVAELNRQLGEAIGLSDGQQVFVKQCSNVLSCKEVTVEPLSANDWDILELHASSLEMHLLNQIRIVYPNAVFPVWVDQYTCIYIQIVALTPTSSYGRLEPLTELIVSPKNQDIETISATITPLKEVTDQSYNENEDQYQSQATKTTVESTEDENGCLSPYNSDSFPKSTSIWNTIGNLLRSLGGKPAVCLPSSDKEIFKMTSLRHVGLEAVFRVSGHIPQLVKSSQAYSDNVNDNCVHVFLWYPELPGLVPDVVVTFGKIQELLSPKRRKESTKKPTEPADKKKNVRLLETPNERTNHTEGLSSAVKIVWHGFEDLRDVIEYDTRNGNTHIGKVWIPKRLRKCLDINISSAVRIKSCGLLPKVPTSVTLQPKETLDSNITSEGIKSAFTAWLQSISTLKMPWISGKTAFIEFLLNEDMLEFLITIDKSTQNMSQDDYYMLCPSFMDKSKINVESEPVLPGEHFTHPNVDQNLPYLKIQDLGGVSVLMMACYDHVVHCLMGRPLSRQLVETASGLRSGGILLFGAKGSGKSTLARAICKEASENLEAHVEEVDCKLLKGKKIESIVKTLEKAFEEAVWRQPAVLLLDDLDHIVGVSSTPEMEQSPEATQSKQLAYVLKDLMKQTITMDILFTVIATGQSDRSLNPLLIFEQGTHLFQCLKFIDPPTQEQRADMLRCVVENRLKTDIAHYADLDLNYLARETEGFVARDFTMLVERAIESAVATRKTFRKQDLILSMTDFEKALKDFTPLSLRNAQLHKPKKQGWNMVGGLHDVCQILKDTIELPAKYPELFANLPIRHRSGVLLYGAPGTGKTLLAGVIAHESRMNFISIKGPELLSKYVGASEQALRDVFTRAQAAKPCILFFDEFDSIAPRRGHDNTGVTDRVVNQMLTQLDGVEGLQGVYFLAATSRPDLIDPALLRPGRLDECLYCPPPDQENNSGSDSDMSLSSIIFLNHSSGSDDSGGDTDSALEQSLASLDMIKLPTEDLNSSMWRLYFGSSYESDLGNGSSSQTSQSFSGSNSITHDFTGLTVSELVPSQPLVFITSSEDHQEHSQKHCQKIDEISSLKANCMDVVCDTRNQTEPKKSLLIRQYHLLNALSTTRPSLSQEDWKFFNSLYENFQNPKKSRKETFKPGQKVTLA
ncbi:hypothetical protein GDO86_011816 [Hymenochirus boettgeri]|uniref:Peroxisomal ATPase PEX1 n=1 Tax=Hymenochirus boettgeri TaxID=247094 RepID=A0A8T2JKX6_9PIPI|nr:hypothetical protein GDO86_011816 [Hymenochirus boettgeri]